MHNTELRRARAGLTQVIEPADSLGVVASKAWGPNRLLEIIQGDTPTQKDWRLLTRQDPGDGTLLNRARKSLGEAIQRWQRRTKYLNPDPALAYISKRGGRFLIPENEHWPSALADLGDCEPLGLWVLGNAVLPSMEKMISIVGSREATAYGSSATRLLVQKSRSMGLTILSGGAYGIDAQAHSEALESPGSGISTVAVLAGGLDRFYPAGNIDLLTRIADQGALISEMPPGMRPNRYRFLHRNRLIAALTKVTIVVEARYRSGALSTANHAHDIGRMVGAVPGPINSPSSAGCHRLIKETPTLLIDSPEDLEALYGHHMAGTQKTETSEQTQKLDMLSVEELLVYEALPIQGRTNASHLTHITGLAIPSIAGILSQLERAGLAEQNTAGWRKQANTAEALN